MKLSEFVRIFPLRAKNIAWFFGAGSSVSAGMPTATDLVWEFKRRIYCSEEGYHLSLFNNLSSPTIRSQIQSYFDSKGSYPPFNCIDEYSFYFELAYKSPRDRSEYLMQQLQGIQNSYGHKAIGILMKNELLKLLFTTNFDKAFENAAVDQLKKMDNFFVASTDNTQTAVQKYHSGMRPFIVKLHGDYFSEKLKNTSEELKSQEAKLRDILYHSCLSNGLAVMGYSGRDESIMEVFDQALDQANSFPNGIFWFVRQETKPLSTVVNFIKKADSAGIQSELVECETFDTAWADIIKGVTLPADDIAQLNTNYFKRANIQLPGPGSKFPVIRFNVIKIEELPTSARLLKCDAGNTKELNQLINSKNGKLIAIRKRNGIVGFGSDEEFNRIFLQYGKNEKDIFQIPDHVLSHEDSSLKGLLTHGLVMAIVREKPLHFVKRRDRYLIMPHPRKINDVLFQDLKSELGQPISGKIPKTDIDWIAGIEILLQKKMSKYFLVISPTIIAAKSTNEIDRSRIAPFIKEAMAKWYNVKYAKLLDVWLDIIFRNEKDIMISSFEENMSGFNAKFKLRRESGFTKTN